MSGWTLRRQPAVTTGMRGLAMLISALASVLASGLLLALLGLHPVSLLRSVLHQSLGNRFGLQDLALLAAPLVVCGLSVATMLRVGLWNIGADGQFLAGATAAAGLGLYGPHWPPAVMLPLLALAGVLGGGAWIAVPAAARLLLGTNEIITTLLLNFIARLGVDWLTIGPWRDQASSVTAQSPRIGTTIPRLPHAWHAGPLHWGLALVPVLALLLAAGFGRTIWGYQLRVCGANPRAAAYAGIPVQRRLLSAMLLSGAIAGLGGMLELAGTVHRLSSGLSNGAGYVGIIVAVLAAGAPLAVLATGLAMALVLDTGTVLQTQGVPASAAMALVGLILLFAALGERLAHYRPMRTRPDREPDP